jgi:glycosyltransferase involved in cell wall biosynthesis
MITKLIKVFFEIRNQFDIFHFNYGSSLVHFKKYSNLDLPFYPKDSRLFVTYQGCDARQKYPTIQRIKSSGGFAACKYQTCYNGICNSGEQDKLRQNKIEKMMRYCEHAFSVNPDLLHFLPKEKSSFLPYTVPNFHNIKEKKHPFFQNDKIKIVHAPTQRVTKGSPFIIKAIEKLKEKFPDKIEFLLIENLPYDQALELYRTADLVIDQILVGWYGGFAVEVMKMGIPVAAYINEEDLKFIPKEMANDLPVINININTIENVLSKIIQNREVLQEIGLKSLQYVNKWHDPLNVASLTKKIYTSHRT